MKNIYLKTLVFALFFCAFLTNCSKDIIEKGADLAPQMSSRLDTNAGNWKTVVLASPADLTLSAPTAATSAEYQQELTNLKATLATLTPAQKAAVTYWGGGATLRWNQILRELVAKHNLPPVENADGIYPIPDANNPFNYPQFPFSNPPYASRAYAYASVAQYDALVTVYFYKKKYNRAMPNQADASIVPALPTTATAGYPSESAALAAVSYQVMKRLFPSDTLYLFEKYNEAKNVDLWAGLAVQSDVDAGNLIGIATATKVMARAGSDNMRFAVGSQRVWDSLATRIASAGGTPWVSVETPKRPPMLPLFGNVKTWLLSTIDLAIVRPSSPPAIGTAEFQAALEEVKSEVTTNSTREKISIVHFWADGVGTHSPPGHWNAIAASLIYAERQSNVRAARNFALLNMTMMDAGVSCWDTKAFYYTPRPSQMDANIKTLTGLPNFPSYTSGHSTFSAAAATFLGAIFPTAADNLTAQAKQASLSRLYGGIHYRFDCDAGYEAGAKIGQFAVNRSEIDGAK